MIKTFNILNKVFATVACSAALLNGCSSASTFADMHIDSLKGVEFGQTRQEVGKALPQVQFTPRPDSQGCTVFSADGVKCSYDAIEFAPNLLFNKKGRLCVINGDIINSEPKLINQLETYLTSKFGKPEVKDTSELWSDGGVKVVLSASGATTGAYNYIGFRSPEF